MTSKKAPLMGALFLVVALAGAIMGGLVHGPTSGSRLSINQASRGECSPIVAGGNVMINSVCKGSLNSPESALSNVDLALSKLVEGHVAFNAPDRATLRDSMRVDGSRGMI
jgi:hypothetical protein